MWPSTLRRIRRPRTASEREKGRVPAGTGERGFSLLEIIVTLVLIASVGAMMVSFLGAQLFQGGRTAEWMQDEFALSSVMERIIADYREELYDGTLVLKDFVEARDTAEEINTPTMYGSDIDEANADPIAFDEDNKEIPATETSTVWKVTLKKGDQTLITIFTE